MGRKFLKCWSVVEAFANLKVLLWNFALYAFTTSALTDPEPFLGLGPFLWKILLILGTVWQKLTKTPFFLESFVLKMSVPVPELPKDNTNQNKNSRRLYFKYFILRDIFIVKVHIHLKKMLIGSFHVWYNPPSILPQVLEKFLMF